MTARVPGGSVLRESGGSHEQEDNGNDCPRNPDPRVAPDGTAGKRAVSGLEKQGWNWINIPSHAKTWKTFLSVYSGELLPLAENLLLASPDDPIPIYRLPHVQCRYARSTKFAAAKPSSLQSIVRAPQGRTENCLKTVLQLDVARIAKHAPINGNRRPSGIRQRES